MGLDWLRRHNPTIDWNAPDLELSCCNLTPLNPVKVSAKGFGLDRQFTPRLQTISTTAVGLGFGLAGSSLSSARASSPSSMHLANAEEKSPQPTVTTDTSVPRSSFLSTLTRWTGYGQSSPPLSRPKPISISCVSAKRFAKYSKNTPVSLLRFHSRDSPVFIASMSSSLASDIDTEPSPSSSPSDDFRDFIPQKYMPWADSVFSPVEVNNLPPHRPYDISIEIEDGKTPPFGPLYRLSLDERQALFDYIDEHMKKGFIRRSTSPAASPVLFTRRKTGELRLCVDYRGLNAITKKNRYPLPLIDDLLDRTQGCSVFSVIDLKNAFNLIRIKDGDEWKTAFRTPLGLYEYLVMPFGLTNAPATFQAFIQDTLRDYLDIFCVVYLDDILIFSKSQEEHDKHVKLILDRLRDANLFANPKKCEFDKSEVQYLGYIIGADGIKMNPAKLSTISNWPALTSSRDVASFLGFTNFYRRFVHRYAQIALPLHDLTKKDIVFSFSDAARSAFEQLKRAFTSYPVLRHFDPLLPCTLSTDASDFAISGVLQQPDDEGSLHPVAYYSRKLTPSEINYDVYDKELLAVIDSFRDMRAWLMGTKDPVAVVCDHKNLEYFMSSRVLNRRQARWSMFLSEFDFRLAWAPGKRNVADAPSRRPDYVPKKGDDVLRTQEQVLLTPIHTERLFPSQDSPSPSSSVPSTTISSLTTLAIDNSELLERFKTAFKKDSEWREAMVRGSPDFTVVDGLVFHKGRLFVPRPLRSEILHSRHDSVLSGHPGRTRTVEFVSRDYSWPGMYTYIRRYVEACDTCPRIKAPRHKPYGLLQPLVIPDRPWKSITMDFIVKLPNSHGFDSILVICDRLTRAAHFIPCNESMNASDLAWLFIDRHFRHHGLPESIISDRGSLFVSYFWKTLCSQLQIQINTSTSYHPRTDGLTERTNQTLETYIRAYCSYQQDDWVDYLPLAEFVFNNSMNTSIKMTPFFANLGFHPTFEPKIADISTVPAADELAKRLDHIHAELRAELAYAQEQQAKYFNKRVLPSPTYKPDQLVWLLRRHIRTDRPSDKLDHRRLGPFPIIRDVGKGAYLLKLPSNFSRLHPVFHTSLLEPYHDPSEFHTHATQPPVGINAVSGDNVVGVLLSRRSGSVFQYLADVVAGDHHGVHVWLPLSELPRSLDPLLERFHRQNPSAPRPSPFELDRVRSPPSFDTPSFDITPINSSSSLSLSNPPMDSHAPSHSLPTTPFVSPLVDNPMGSRSSDVDSSMVSLGTSGHVSTNIASSSSGPRIPLGESELNSSLFEASDPKSARAQSMMDVRTALPTPPPPKITAYRRPRSPRPVRLPSLKELYTPPTQTLLRTGRLSKPPARFIAPSQKGG